MSRVILYFIHFIFAISFCAHAGNTAKNSIKIVTEDLPPLQIQQDNLPPTGVMVDIVNLLIAESKLETNIELYPWARAYHLSLTRPNTIIFSMFREQSREQKFHWIGRLYTIKAYLAGLKSNNLNIKNLEEAKKHSIATVRYDLAENYLLDKGFVEGKNLVLSSRYHDAWRLLFNKRSTLVFTTNAIWQSEVENLGYNPDDITLLYELPDFASELYIAASLGTDPDVVKKLSQALTRIKQDGRFQQILNQWHFNY